MSNVPDFPPLSKTEVIINVRSKISEAIWLIAQNIDKSEFELAKFYAKELQREICKLETLLEYQEENNE
jgi:hypothetical protein